MLCVRLPFPHPDLMPNRLRDVVAYDRETGGFTWRETLSNRAVAGRPAGSFRRDGYGRLQIDGREYLMHRLAWLYEHGKWPEGDIDHINRDPSDNRIANLRDVTHSQNLQNTGAPRTNKSGFKGVSQHKNGRWKAEIKLAQKTRHLGYFDTAEEASRAYARAASEVHTHNPTGKPC